MSVENVAQTRRKVKLIDYLDVIRLRIQRLTTQVTKELAETLHKLD
jgi:hypothetical protein